MHEFHAPIFEDKVVDFIVALAKVEERRVPVAELLADPDSEASAAAEAPAEPEEAAAPTAKPKARRRSRKAEAGDGG
jgi:trigger factor